MPLSGGDSDTGLCGGLCRGEFVGLRCCGVQGILWPGLPPPGLPTPPGDMPPGEYVPPPSSAGLMTMPSWGRFGVEKFDNPPRSSGLSLEGDSETLSLSTKIWGTLGDVVWFPNENGPPKGLSEKLEEDACEARVALYRLLQYLKNYMSCQLLYNRDVFKNGMTYKVIKKPLTVLRLTWSSTFCIRHLRRRNSSSLHLSRVSVGG